LLLIGLLTKAVRIIGQLPVPVGEQTVLTPSILAQNGTMPLAFTISGIFAYSIIAALFPGSVKDFRKMDYSPCSE